MEQEFGAAARQMLLGKDGPQVATKLFQGRRRPARR
jgi:hypothetical protein